MDIQSIYTGVRLGRCPKKDKPAKSNFFKLPQNAFGSVDVDKQIKTEQMILTIHEAFRNACTSFNKYSSQFDLEEVI